MSAEALLAAIILAVCMGALLRMAIGQTRRDKLDAILRRHSLAVTRRARALWRQRRLRGQARREADDLIRRAKQGKPGVDREGNVYRPRSFDGRDRHEGRERNAPDGRNRKDH